MRGKNLRVKWVVVSIGVLIVLLLIGIGMNAGSSPTPTVAPVRIATLSTATSTRLPAMTPTSPATVAPTATMKATAATPTALAPINTPTPSLATPSMPSVAQGVHGLDNDPVNVRERPSVQSPVVALLNPNTDAQIAGPSETDAQGQRWLWVRLGPGGKDGYVRADLVSAPPLVAAQTSASPTPPGHIGDPDLRPDPASGRVPDYR